MRYFLTTTAFYELTRRQLNETYGIPRPGTERVMPDVTSLVRSPDGGVAVAVPARLCAHPTAVAIIGQALASGQVREITESQYQEWARLTRPNP